MIKLLLSMLLVLLFISFSNAQEPEQKLYRIYSEDFSRLKNIEATGITVYNSKLDTYFDVLALPEQIDNLGIEGIRVEFIANSFKELLESRMKTGSYNDYHNYQATNDLMVDFANSFPEITTLDTIGYSNLGRAICCLKISDNPQADEDEAPILMVGCHHGNEVLSVEATLFQIDFLVNNYGTDSEVTQWIDNMEIWYVPLLNPDGREDIRRTNDNGVDLNRNYSYEHTAVGNHGPYGFSEPETQAIRDLSALYPPIMSLTYHTSGRLVLLPWTHTDESAPDSLAFTYLGNIIAESITFPVGGSTGHYELRQGGDWYFTAGEYCDYMYATHNTQAFTIEMWTRQTPPADVIPQVVERNLEGMKTLFRQASRAGVTGQVTDKITGFPVIAKIDFPVFDNQGKLPDRFSDQLYGRYYRFLEPGVNTMEVSAPGYRSITEEIDISADNLLVMDLEMDPAPDLQLREFTLSDASGNRILGNGDGLVNLAETLGVFITLYNDQQISAQGSYLKVTSSSPYIDLITDSLYFGAIAHYSEIQSKDTLLFKLKPDCPDSEILNFNLDIIDEISFARKSNFSFEAYTPNLEINEVIIRDDEGNQNGIIDKGETVMVGLQLANTGRQSINDVQISFVSDDPYFSVQTEPVNLSNINKNQSAFVEFQVVLSPQTPDNYSTYVSVNLISSETYEEQLKVALNNIFGFIDDFENGINGWTHASYGTSSNSHDDWQLGKPAGKAGDPSFAFSGNNCWGTDMGWDSYMGDSWNGEYQNNVHNYLLSPPIDCSNMTEVGLRYRKWLNTRVSDIARIKVNDNLVWKSSVRGHSDQEWIEHLIDISDFADGNPYIRIKFELETSSANALGGWNIDDVLVANKLASGSTMVETLIDDYVELFDCYPNPFNSSTNIEYRLVSFNHIKIWVTDALGRKVKTLLSINQSPGNYSISWDGRNDFGQALEPGIYNISLSGESFTVSKRVILIR